MHLYRMRRKNTASAPPINALGGIQGFAGAAVGGTPVSAIANADEQAAFSSCSNTGANSVLLRDFVSLVDSGIR